MKGVRRRGWVVGGVDVVEFKPTCGGLVLFACHSTYSWRSVHCHTLSIASFVLRVFEVETVPALRGPCNEDPGK